jgi:OmpA family
MKALLVGVALLAFTVPAAYAQSASQEVPPPEMEGPGQYRVFFAFDRPNLTEADRQIIAQAAEDYRRTGMARITATGHTDTSGSAAYNLELSQRRAEAVASELVRQGVPATDIVTIGRGEEDLLVPTADGVREPRNRRVEIVIPQPPAAAPAPVAEAPAAAPMPEPAPAEPDRFTFALGPVYGHNFGETDKDSGGKTENDLVGAELTFRALPGFLGGVSLKQMGLWSLNGIDDGLTGRSVASLDFAPDFGIFRPTLAINGGGVYGKGVQDGFVAGPEIRFDIAPFGGFNFGIMAAYDYQFRNAGWDEGILWAGLDFGIRF